MTARNQKPTVEETTEDSPAVSTEPAPNNSARPNDVPIGKYAVENSTFAQRAKARIARDKRVGSAQAKSVDAEDAEKK